MKKTFWQKVWYVLLYIWQIPQNLLALCLIFIFKILNKVDEITVYKDINYVWIHNWYNGVSLGNYVILCDCYKERLDTINHEYGHTCQSKYLGLLYLLLIGLPSGTWNLIDRLLSIVIPKRWTYTRSYKVYYSMPWEHWADVLGGVERHFN